MASESVLCDVSMLTVNTNTNANTKRLRVRVRVRARALWKRESTTQSNTTAKVKGQNVKRFGSVFDISVGLRTNSWVLNGGASRLTAARVGMDILLCWKRQKRQQKELELKQLQCFSQSREELARGAP